MLPLLHFSVFFPRFLQFISNFFLNFFSRKKIPHLKSHFLPKKCQDFYPPPIFFPKTFFLCIPKKTKVPIGTKILTWNSMKMKFDIVNNLNNFFWSFEKFHETLLLRKTSKIFFRFFVDCHVQILTKFRRKFQNLTFFWWIWWTSTIGKTIKNTKK